MRAIKKNNSIALLTMVNPIIRIKLKFNCLMKSFEVLDRILRPSLRSKALTLSLNMG